MLLLKAQNMNPFNRYYLEPNHKKPPFIKIHHFKNWKGVVTLIMPTSCPLDSRIPEDIAFKLIIKSSLSYTIWLLHQRGKSFHKLNLSPKGL